MSFFGVFSAGALKRPVATLIAVLLTCQWSLCWADDGSIAAAPASNESAPPVVNKSTGLAVNSSSGHVANESMEQAVSADASTDNSAKPSANMLASAAPPNTSADASPGAPADSYSSNPPRTILSGGTSITPSAANDRIDDLTRDILLKEIELERFNLHYTLEVAKQGRWKGWRYAGFQEVNSGMGLAGAIIGTGERGQHLHTPGKIHNAMQENANFIPMIGAIIGASAAALEFSINTYHDIIARRKGFSPHVARKYVMGVKMEVNRLLTERDRLIQVQAEDPALSCNVQVDNAEGKVLRDLRDQALREFERFHVGARKVIAFQQMQYFFDFTKYTTNAIGYEFAFLSLHRHRRIWNGRAGTMWNVSGPLYMAGPILSRMFANYVVGPITKYTLKDTMAEADANVATLQADLATLDQVCKNIAQQNATEDAVVHSSMYGLHEKKFENEIQAAEKKRGAARLTATQNIGAGLYVGGTKLAQGILFTIPGFNHNYNGKGKRADHVTNDELLVGSIISLPAGLFSMLDTLRIQVRGEISRHKLAKAGMLPQQLAGKRLGELDEMEKVLRAM